MSTARRRTRLTRRGTAILIGASAVLAAGIVLRIGELLAIGAAGMLMVPIAYLRIRRASARVKLEAQVSHRPARPLRGRPATVGATLRNRGRRPVVVEVAVEARFVRDQPRGSLRIAPGATASVSSTSEAWRRGRHSIGPVHVALGDGAGLAEAIWQEHAVAETLILPSFTPVEGAPTLPPEERPSGPARRSPLRGTEFHALREYQRGDDLRQVHWRASAKHGSLLVRELEPLALPRFTVLLDDRSVAYQDALLFEMAVTTAASVVSGLGKKGFGVRLITSEGRAADHGYGRGSMDAIIERLATVDPQPVADLSQAIRRSVPSGRGGGIVLVAPTVLDPASLTNVSRAAARFGFAGALLIGRSAGNAGGEMMKAGWRAVRLAPTGDALLDRRVPVQAWRKLLELGR